MFTTVLMIEKALSSADVELVTTLHGDEDVAFTVLMQPRGSQDELLRALDDVALGHLEQVAHEHEETEAEKAAAAGHDPAQQALEVTLRRLRAAGAQAVGRVVQKDPLSAVRGVVSEIGADEVVVLTAPHYVEELFHRDWASRARHKVGVPVLKLFAHEA